MSHSSLQQQFAKKSICFGCGPSNPNGLQLESFVEDDKVIAQFEPKTHHYAFPNVLNGGIIGTILDCHCNWAAAWFLMQAHQSNEPPCTVTAEYTIKLKQTTTMKSPISLEARLVSLKNQKAYIYGELRQDNVITASCDGLFIAVKPDHPAYYRW